MNPPAYRTARALYPHRPEMWEPEYLYEPLTVPVDHPEFDLFGIGRMRKENEAEDRSGWREPAAEALSTFNLKPETSAAEPLRARMLNEFVYCPRLFYYEQVEGVFVENADTARGAAIHEKVDRGKGALPKAKRRSGVPPDTGDAGILPAADAAAEEPAKKSEAGTHDHVLVNAATADDDHALTSAATTDDAEPPGETIHSRSAMLSSARLDVVAKMDLIEVKMTARSGEDLFASREVQSVTPVDYKAGAPRQGVDQNELWDADKMQLGLQILILRDNGYTCDEGVIYYRATKQRVRLAMTAEIEAWIIERIAAA
ncbi:MAG: Dna2/Cas4 domain-containing protein, partial [Prosthecobacter sp.]|nr:Dna2/Cas4 domain-containing protein [Prosthecobacter sp.]